MLHPYSVSAAARFFISILVAVGSLAGVSTASSQQPATRVCPPEATDCYTVGGRRVDLEWSPRYESVTFSSPPRNRDVEVLARRIEAGINPIGRIKQHPLLDTFGVILIELYEDVSPERVREAISGLDFSGDKRIFLGRDPAASGNPVYRSRAADFILVNQLTLHFKDNVEGATRQSVLDALAREHRGMEVVRDYSRRNWYVLRFPTLTARQTLALANRLNTEETVEFAEPDFISVGGPALPTGDVERTPGIGGAASPGDGLCPAAPPNGGTDPYFASQWYLDSAAMADVNAVKAWTLLGESQSDIVVAIIDSGVQANHEDLSGQVLVSMGGDTTDSPKTPAGTPGKHVEDAHGTAVAGIVNAITGNPRGIKGLGPGVKLVSVRVMYWAPDDDIWAAHPTWFAAGIEIAAEVAHVLNNSWYSVPDTGQIESSINYALGLGRTLVFAAGNQWEDAPSPVLYPAILSTTKPILAVGASNQTGGIYNWSMEGLTNLYWGSLQGVGLSMVAPGTQMITTDLMGNQGYCKTGGYSVFWGTSAAAPLVAAAAALVIAKNPALSPAQVRDKLLMSAKHPTPSGRPTAELGWGLLDACRALDGGTTC